MSNMKNMWMLFVSVSLDAGKHEKKAPDLEISRSASAAVVAVARVNPVGQKPTLKKQDTELTKKREAWQKFQATLPKAKTSTRVTLKKS